MIRYKQICGKVTLTEPILTFVELYNSLYLFFIFYSVTIACCYQLFAGLQLDVIASWLLVTTGVRTGLYRLYWISKWMPYTLPFFYNLSNSNFTVVTFWIRDWVFHNVVFANLIIKDTLTPDVIKDEAAAESSIQREHQTGPESSLSVKLCKNLSLHIWNRQVAVVNQRPVRSALYSINHDG